MTHIAYLAQPPYLSQFLVQIWPFVAPHMPLKAYDAAHNAPCIVLGAALLPAGVSCLVMGGQKPLAQQIAWLPAPASTASVVQHIRLWLADLADTPLTLPDGVVFNPRTRQFGPHTLTEKEVATLQFLRAQPKHTATRAALQQHVWGYALDADTHTVETHIYRLRQKIEPNPTAPHYVVTNDDGYCLRV